MTRKTKEEQLNFADAFDWKLAHGGKRANAGRKIQEPTKVVRVPVGVLACLAPWSFGWVIG